jgi:hypothetical protein
VSSTVSSVMTPVTAAAMVTFVVPVSAAVADLIPIVAIVVAAAVAVATP